MVKPGLAGAGRDAVTGLVAHPQNATAAKSSMAI
jgi:hypothetical protein